jgi:signal-transduction protein with cAMP-binding, CBS, and nucleotidyltransferase domain
MVTAFLMMQQKNIRHLGVLDNNKITGVISIRDIANYYVSKLERNKGFAPKLVEIRT